MALRLQATSLADRADAHAWMTAPGIIERMMGPPTFPELAVPDLEDFCEDWVEHYWTHASPEAGRVFLLVDGAERLGLFAHNDVVTTPDGRRAVEIDLWLRDAGVVGKGYGPAGVALLCARVRADLDADLAFLQPSARNPGAIRAYEKAGFVRWPMSPARAAAHFSTAPDYEDSVFFARELPPVSAAAARIERLADGVERAPLEALLRLADDSASEVASYREDGVAFALRLDEAAPLAGVVLVTDLGTSPELKNVAVREDLQGQGLGSYLVRDVLLRLAADGASQARLATATADVDVLRFYQRLGFRLTRIEPDWFTPERGYAEGLAVDGVPVRDRVWLERALLG